MQGVGEPDEEQEAGYPQQHLQLCPPSAPPSELGDGWLGYHPGVSAGQDRSHARSSHHCNALLNNYVTQVAKTC